MCSSGVPFAQPPVGDLRWRAPQKPVKWIGERYATSPMNRPARNRRTLTARAPMAAASGGTTNGGLPLSQRLRPGERQERTDRGVALWRGVLSRRGATWARYNGTSQRRAGRDHHSRSTIASAALGSLSHPALTKEAKAKGEGTGALCTDGCGCGPRVGEAQRRGVRRRIPTT